MESLFLLIPLSLLLVGLAIWVFLRMSDSGQFDDMEGPAHSILMDDDRPRGAKGQPPAVAQPTQPTQPTKLTQPTEPAQPTEATEPPAHARNPAGAQLRQQPRPRASAPRNE